MRHGALARLLTGLLAMSLVAGCQAIGAPAERSDAEARTIRYHSGPGLINHLELADALGYYDGTGIKLKNLGQVAGGPELLRSLATNQSDLAIGPFHGATARVVSTGVPLKAVAATYGSTAKNRMGMEVMTPEDSEIHSARDLIGGSVAVNTLGANAEAVVDTWLDAEGLSQDEIDEVTLVPLPGINTEAALRAGKVDAAVLNGAPKEFALKNGGLRTLAADVDLMGDYNGGSYTLRTSFIEQHRDLTRSVVEGIARAIHWEQTHKPAEVHKVMGDWLKAHGRADEIESLLSWRGSGIATRGGVLRDEDFDAWIDWLDAEGQIDVDRIDISQLYTNEFNPYASEEDQK
ncbi:hypothetical protein ASG90_15375 [Nocardioides sp. Soil797]|nr:hypothetical protein ASG90_15375 [Nocardioides sp. Soil797]